MNKKEILNLSNTMLFVHILDLEDKMSSDIALRGSISKPTIKDFKISMEEIAKRFNMDLDVIIKERHLEHFWG